MISFDFIGILSISYDFSGFPRETNTLLSNADVGTSAALEDIVMYGSLLGTWVVLLFLDVNWITESNHSSLLGMFWSGFDMVCG